MLLHVSVSEGYIGPLGVGLTIPVGVDEVLSEKVTLEHVLLVLLSVQHLGHLGETLVGPLEVVGNLTLTSLTLLGGDEYYTVTSLSTVDGC